VATFYRALQLPRGKQLITVVLYSPNSQQVTQLQQHRCHCMWFDHDCDIAESRSTSA